jgi:hypothetical protein
MRAMVIPDGPAPWLKTSLVRMDGVTFPPVPAGELLGKMTVAEFLIFTTRASSPALIFANGTLVPV